MKNINLRRRIILTLLVGLFSISMAICHPLKLSVCDIDLKGKVLTVQVKLFYDDLEVELTNYYKKEVKIYNESLTGERLKLIENYLNAHFQLKINGTAIPLKIKSAQMNGDQVLVAFEQNYQKPKKLERVLVLNKILFNSIPEQKNIVNIKLKEGPSPETLLFENENQTTIREITY